MQSEILGYTFAAFVLLPIIVQMALALGAPIGRYTLGGRFPGQLPRRWRVLALVQAGLLGGMTIIVLDHTGSLGLGLPQVLIYIVLGLTVLSLLANAISPSRPERLMWTPVTALMTGTLVGALLV
ncbi:hypothetical protein [Pelagibacterium sp. H642]|uniref:hypothetical protein n=1 Tax=Pelagibacterium sp. H642 TaxID=1881069 RepID=UPI0028156305|nr:hypothetical protein [Pelagibacterium sp. H642]WMT92695.1 hypothetical protein NO934_20390 [Pelagibacterium sp. H642]